MNKKFRTLLVWLCLVVGFVALYALQQEQPLPRRSIEAFQADVAAGTVREIWYRDESHFAVELTAPSGERYEVVGDLSDEDLLDKLYERDLTIHWERPMSGYWLDLAKSFLPIIVVIVIFFLLLRRMSGQGGKTVLELRKSNARVLKESAKVTFSDVGGCEEAKLLLGDVITFLRDPSAWQRAGVRLPRGILLQGPPGCGKSLLARAVAGETSATFLYISASEFCELFIGVGAARIRDLFERARKESPCVIFIDEIDSVGRRRGSGMSSLTNDEREQTLNQLLVCMDGLENAERVVVIAATNRPDILDRALLRTGRFDRIIQIPPLSEPARRSVLEIHSRGKKLASSSVLDEIARRTDGKTGAELETVCNEAGVLAVRRALSAGGGAVAQLELEDFIAALSQVEQRTSKFSALDLLLIESSSQLSEPVAPSAVRIFLDDGQTVTGTVLWADANFLKLASGNSGETRLVSKKQVKAIEPTEEAAA